MPKPHSIFPVDKPRLRPESIFKTDSNAAVKGEKIFSDSKDDVLSVGLRA